MTEQTSSGGGSTPWVAFLVGAVIVGAIAFAVFANSNNMQQPTTPNITITSPRIEAPDIRLPDVQPPALPASPEAAPATQ